MKKIFIADTFVPEHINSFKAAVGTDFEITLYSENICMSEQVCEADVIIAYGKDLDKSVLERAAKLQLIVKLGTAKGKLDTDYLSSKNIPLYVTESPALISVAEHAFAFILALSKEIVYSDNGVRANLNPNNARSAYTDQLNYAYNWLDLKRFDGLYGKTIGIVGFGVVGQRLARMANSFDMDVIYYDLHKLSPEKEKELNVRYGSFDDVISQGDYISSHLKLNDSTKHLFNKDVFSKMKSTACFINTSRGPIVCEADLVWALKSGKIGGAALDVFEVEPLPENSPLRECENVLLSAHTAGIQLYKSLFTEFRKGAELIATCIKGA